MSNDLTKIDQMATLSRRAVTIIDKLSIKCRLWVSHLKVHLINYIFVRANKNKGTN